MSDGRRIELARIEKARYTATNVRGGTMTIGEGKDTDFTPVELLLVAIGACTAFDVDYITSKRAEPTVLDVDVTANKVRDEQGNHLNDIVATFRARFPDGPEGDAARAVLPDAVKKSNERLCTVSRTVEIGIPITPRIE